MSRQSGATRAGSLGPTLQLGHHSQPRHNSATLSVTEFGSVVIWDGSANGASYISERRAAANDPMAERQMNGLSSCERSGWQRPTRLCHYNQLVPGLLNAAMLGLRHPASI